MRILIFIVVCIVWGFIIKGYASPDIPAMTEYTFGSGLVHGASWWILLLVKWFGAPIQVFADLHTTGYTIGFIIGCLLGTVIAVSLFIVSILSDAFE